MTKAITFLGVRPRETAYAMPDGTICTAPHFGAALASWRRGLKMHVFVTQKAAEEQLGPFTRLVANDVAYVQPVTIPNGDDSTQLWEIFEQVVQAVEEGEEVIFDITHGYRSLPFLSFLAAAYLRVVKQIKLESVLYGNFEAIRDSASPAPVIDMTPFVSLLDWTVAADQFIQTGNARRLAGLLRPSGATEGPAVVASETLSAVSLAAFLCQPFLLMPKAYLLKEHLRAAETQLYAEVKPYQTLQKRIINEFGAFGTAPGANESVELQAQLRMIKWYKRNSQLIQAVTLAREWLISAVTIRLKQPVDVRPEPRKQMELAVSGLSLVGRRKVRDEQGGKRLFDRRDLNVYGQQIYDSWPEYEQIRRLWDKLSLVRNSLDHAGYQPDKLSVDDMVDLVDKEIMLGLTRLALAWGFVEE